MRLLLDTNVLLWLLGAPQRLPAALLAQLSDLEWDVMVSAASAFEIAQKTRAGKLHGQVVVENWGELLRANSLRELELDGAHMIRAGTLDWPHRDPFDRMIVAQAIGERATLVTADRVVLATAPTSCLAVGRG